MAEKKTIPGFSQGVRINGQVRTVKLAAPICPNSQQKRNSDGSIAYVGPNCQLEGGQWWLACEARGHNPYFSKRTYYETVDVTDADGFVIGTKKKPITIERPNVVQVQLSRRHHSGQGVTRSMERKGRKRLSDLGYEEVCQYRNCQDPVRVVNSAFGAYCSQSHLMLVAADEQEIFLPQPGGLEGAHSGKTQQKRDKMLRDSIAGSETRKVS
jgi:hypothetical protein